MNMRIAHRTPDAAPEEEPRPSTSVHVLNDEHDLRAALQRAAAFDRRTAEMLRTRSARYQALLGDPEPDDLGS
jgi:hypothetical protein